MSILSHIRYVIDCSMPCTFTTYLEKIVCSSELVIVKLPYIVIFSLHNVEKASKFIGTSVQLLLSMIKQ